VDITLALGNSAPDIISILSSAWVHLGSSDLYKLAAAMTTLAPSRVRTSIHFDDECKLVRATAHYDLTELIKAAGQLGRVMEVRITAVALRIIF
jgi:hypothetical protein